MTNDVSNVTVAVTCQWLEGNEARLVFSFGTRSGLASTIPLRNPRSLGKAIRVELSRRLHHMTPNNVQNIQSDRIIVIFVFEKDQNNDGRQHLQNTVKEKLTERGFQERNLRFDGFVSPSRGHRRTSQVATAGANA